MGDRAVITTRDNFNHNGIGVYVHSYGDVKYVKAFLEYCKRQFYRTPDRDNYGWARLCQTIGNCIGSGLSVGIDILSNLDCDNGNNGVYIIEGWDIVEMKYPDREVPDVPVDEDFINRIDECQPVGIRLKKSS